MDIPVVHIWQIQAIRRMAEVAECEYKMFTVHRSKHWFEVQQVDGTMYEYPLTNYTLDTTDFGKLHYAVRVNTRPRDLFLVLLPSRDKLTSTQLWLKEILGETIQPDTYMLHAQKENN